MQAFGNRDRSVLDLLTGLRMRSHYQDLLAKLCMTCGWSYLVMSSVAFSPTWLVY